MKVSISPLFSNYAWSQLYQKLIFWNKEGPQPNNCPRCNCTPVMEIQPVGFKGSDRGITSPIHLYLQCPVCFNLKGRIIESGVIDVDKDLCKLYSDVVLEWNKPMAPEKPKSLWRPIETFDPVNHRYSVFIKNGNEIHQAWYDNNSHTKNPKPFFKIPGLRDGDSRDFRPTHWIPLSEILSL